MSILAIGPYLGDFESEIYIFLPFVKWVSSILDNDRLIVSSHFNRQFLYENFVDDFIPVSPLLTINELNQKGVTYKTIDKIEYTSYVKNFQEQIKEKYNITKKDINNYQLNYVKNKQVCSIYQLKFDPLMYKKKEKKYVVFIPDRKEKESKLKEIFHFLKNTFDEELIIIGDKKCHLNDENYFINDENYTSHIYEEIINYISNAKLVISPISHWTFIANLQKIPVFSWGKFVQQFKEFGDYNLDNKKCKILYTDKNTKPEKIIKHLNWVIEKEKLC